MPSQAVLAVGCAAIGAAAASFLLPKLKRALAKKALAEPLVLSYFGIPGPGEPCRMLLALSGRKWTNKDISGADGGWAKLKPSTKWGQIPILETADGLQLSQSVAMARMLAKMTTVGGVPLYPDDIMEAFAVDEFVDALSDMRSKFAPTFSIKDQAEKEAARKAIMIGEGGGAVLLTKMEAAAGTEFACGTALSLADIHVAFVVGMISSGFLDGLDVSLLAPYPKLLAIAKKVYALPELNAYYSERAVAKPLYKCFVV